MIHVTSPGLPPWPRLWLDRETCRAKVVVRHATWRSYEWSYRATEVISWSFKLTSLVFAWNWIPTPDLIYRIVFVLLLACICFPIIDLISRSVFRGLLARQVFATKTTFWATPKAIVFKSRVFTQPVVIWRHWKGRLINTRLIIQADPEAASYANDGQGNKNFPRGPINEAMLLLAVIPAPTRRDMQSQIGSDVIRRSLPITEVSSRCAAEFSTVFTAAMMLTAESSEEKVHVMSSGTDIDAN